MFKRALSFFVALAFAITPSTSYASNYTWVDNSGKDPPDQDISVDGITSADPSTPEEDLPVSTPVPETPAVFADVSTAEAQYGDFAGLLSECWELALEAGSGTVTLLQDVQASAYDTAVYNGTSYVDENGVEHQADSHAITRFAGGLRCLTVPSGADITLDLAGHTLDRNMESADGTADRAYTVEAFDGGTLTITGPGKITGGYGASDETCNHKYGSCIIVHSGATVNLNDVEISGNDGNGAVLGDGNINLSGATRIFGNYDAAGVPANLMINSTATVTASNIAPTADISFTVTSGNSREAISYPNGSADRFMSDIGLTATYNNGYVGVESIEVPYEVEYTDSKGVKQTGTWAEMWTAMCNDTGNTPVTLKLMKDVTTSGTYRFEHTSAHAVRVTIDFNGHVLKATGSASQQFISIYNNCYVEPFILTDSAGRVRSSTKTVSESGSPGWNADTRTYTYYTSHVIDGGLDSGRIPVIDRVTADCSYAGGLDLTGYGDAIYVANGNVSVQGGVHCNSGGGFVHSVWAYSIISMTGGYVFDCGTTSRNGGAFFVEASKSFTMSGGTIAGCRALSGGGLSLGCPTVTITGGEIANCSATAVGGGLLLIDQVNSASISGLSVCNNKAQSGGAVSSVSPDVRITNTSFTCNSATSAGGAVNHSGAVSAIAIDSCELVGNTSYLGGAVYSSSGVISLVDCAFTQNVGSDSGGGINYVGGSCSLERVSMSHNTAPKGRDLYVSADNLEIKDGNTVSNCYLALGKSLLCNTEITSTDIQITLEAVPVEGSDVLVLRNPSVQPTSTLLSGIKATQGYFTKLDAPNIYFGVNEDITVQAEYVASDGTVTQGSLNNMWQLLNTNVIGTVRLLQDVNMTGTLSYSGTGPAVFDFQGHTLTATGSSGSYLFNIQDNTEAFTFKDSGGTVTETRTPATSVAHAEWNSATRKVTYYDADSNYTLKAVTSDLSKMGGVVSTGYSRIIRCAAGNVVIDGGMYNSDNEFCTVAGGVVTFNDGYVVGCGKSDVAEGGGFLVAWGTLNMSGGKIIGCQAGYGGAIHCKGKLNITGGSINSCRASVSGAGIYLSSTVNLVSITNARIAGNPGSGIMSFATVDCTVDNSEFLYNGLDVGFNVDTAGSWTFSDSMFAGAEDVNIRTQPNDTLTFSSCSIEKLLVTGGTVNIGAGNTIESAVLQPGTYLTMTTDWRDTHVSITSQGYVETQTPTLIVDNPKSLDTSKAIPNIVVPVNSKVTERDKDIYISMDIDSNSEAAYIDANSYIVASGSFDEMWEKLKSENQGTLRLYKDVHVVDKTYTWNKSGSPILDFNGHVIHATSSTGGCLFDQTNGTLTFTDSTGVSNLNKEKVDETSDCAWNPDTREYTYYESSLSTDGEDFITSRVTADYTHLGGIDATGYGRAVRVQGGTFTLKGGAHRSDNGFLVASAGNVVMLGGIVFDSGDQNISSRVENQLVFIEGGAFYMQSGSETLDIQQGSIIGCEARQGGAIRATGKVLTVTDGLFTCNYGKFNGGFAYIDSACSTAAIRGGKFCDNKAGERGGVVMYGNADSVLGNAQFIHNSAVTGGAIEVYATRHQSTIANASFVGNRAEQGGAFGEETNGDTTLLFTGVNLHRNSATVRGGAIDAINGTIAANNTIISHNDSPLGGGIYLGVRGTVGDNFTVKDNTTNNVYLKSGYYLTVDEDKTPGEIWFSAEDVPTEGNPVTLLRNTSSREILEFKGHLFLDTTTTTTTTTTILYRDFSYQLSVASILNAVEIQHWGYLKRVVRNDARAKELGWSGADSTKLSLISTEGKALPNNSYHQTSVVIPWKYMYINDTKSIVDGRYGVTHEVIKDLELTKIFRGDYVDEGDVQLSLHNKAYRNKYYPTKVWKWKGLADYDTVVEDTTKNVMDPSYWDEFDYSEDLIMTLARGDRICIIYNQTEEDGVSVRTLFYDYDITNGSRYGSQNNAKKLTNPLLNSTYTSGNTWVNTSNQGIHTPTNYSDNGSKLAFGNANAGTDMDKITWASPNGTVLINRLNRTNGVDGSVTQAKGATFKLASHLDSDGYIVFSEGIDAPSLFGREAAKGKRLYIDHTLEFERYGDTYTLTRVQGTELDNLQYFHNPQAKYNTIWTNDFWPMDYVPTWGADGHDIKFGRAGHTISAASNNGKLPVSDDGRDHNAYFGMNFKVDFELPADYIGPLEFQFFGDDDLWVFLDDKLICDIGGVHLAIGEYVNLADWVTPGDTSRHSLSVFFTERGASGSTCWMKFTLPNIISTTEIPSEFVCAFEKTDPTGKLLEGAEFTLYEDEACTIVHDVQVSNEKGHVMFSTLDGNEYWMKETKTARDTDELPDTTWKLEYQEDSKSWLLYNLADVRKTHMAQIINYPKISVQMPETGATELLDLINNAVVLLTVSGLLFYLARRLRR